MRARGLFVLPIVAALTGLSCDETFSPKEPLENRAFLYCIVNFSRLETTTQYALVNRSYDVSGTNPVVNTIDPFVQGAEMKLTVRSTEYSFRSGSLSGADTTRYGTPQRYYAARNVLVYPAEAVNVSAYLTDGTRLSGHTIVPAIKPLDSHPVYATGFTTLVNRFTQGNSYVLDWEDGSHEGHLFFPSMTLTYEREDDTSGARTFSVRIPTGYVMQNGVRVGVYPRPSTATHCEFTFEAIDDAMGAIAAGDTVKSRYRPVSLKFAVVECDFALTRYYMSVNGSLDQYSLRLDESTYTNVQGGGGVVGSTTTFGINNTIDPRYSRLFGYR
jgi:hypothetical protein